MNLKTSEVSSEQQKKDIDSLKIGDVEKGADFEMSKEITSADSESFETKTPAVPQKEKKTLPKIKKKVVLPSLPRDAVTLKVEKILAEGLDEDYKKLPPIVQQEFKLKGEQTASKISELLKKAKIKIKSIFRLILEWLSLLPNVNRFFLEQEAKIKTDKIINLKKQ